MTKSGYDRSLSRKQAHDHIKRTCACGRVLRGNGGLRHMRTCEINLRESGYRLDVRMAAAVRDEYPTGSAHVIRAIEKRLGEDYLTRRAAGDLSELSWSEYRDRVWRYADEAAAPTWPVS